MPAGLQPAWVLHRRSYGDGGFLVEMFTLDQGRLSTVLRGARRKARGGSAAGLAQPFTPLLIEIGGRGDLKMLRRIEAVSAGIALPGRALFSGLYINELLMRMLPRYDPQPGLFAQYGALLPGLADRDSDLAIRTLELALLDELGYGLRFDRDSQGADIDQSAHYRFDPERGFTLSRFSHSEENAVVGAVISGDLLAEIHLWLTTRQNLSEQSRRELKHIVRIALARHLGDKPLRSRALLRAFLAGKAAPTAALAEPVENITDGVLK